MKSAELDCADKLIRAYIDGSQEDFNKQLKRGVINSIFPVTVSRSYCLNFFFQYSKVILISSFTYLDCKITQKSTS